jgi:hypothetical protein
MKRLAGILLFIVSQGAHASTQTTSIDPLALFRTATDVTARFIVNAADSRLSILSPSELKVLDDETFSWTQPSDPDFGGYNGRCGEVAAANIQTMIAQRRSPVDVARFMYDATPGTLPSTLANYLQKHAPGQWAYGRSSSLIARKHMKQFLSFGEAKAANGRSPIAALIQVHATGLHWVTIVDFDEGEDQIVYNDHGKQTKRDFVDFAKDWGFANASSSPATRAVIASACCSPYTLVYQAGVSREQQQ